MIIINLKQGTLEEKMVGIKLSEASKVEIEKEIRHYDEYYFLPRSQKLVKGFRQGFVKDPFMDLGPMHEVRIMPCDPDSADIGELEEIFDMDTVPIITRTSQKTLPRFTDIPGKYREKSILNPIRISISPEYSAYANPNIHKMSEEHLPTIEELFRQQYSLRYRLVHLMWKECPEACFIYVVHGRVIGTTFNRIESSTFYMRQIFVHEDYRARGIGDRLYRQRLSFATQRNLKFATAQVRAESLWFHERFGAKIFGNDSHYVIRR